MCMIPILNPNLPRNTPPAANKNNITFPLFFTFGSLFISIPLSMLKYLIKRLFNCFYVYVSQLIKRLFKKKYAYIRRISSITTTAASPLSPPKDPPQSCEPPSCELSLSDPAKKNSGDVVVR